MISQINDPTFVSTISSNQTSKLIEKYKQLDTAERKIVDILDEVNLTTSENIHLNSFMYEPILDMSDEHLKELYKKVKF